MKEATRQIKFNTLELSLRDVKVRLGDGETVEPSSVDISVVTETATLTFDRPIPAGTATLSLSFSGELNDKMKGMYRSKYTSVDGEERYSAVTQFEATDARRCFPCWDEPALKATFNITLVVPKDRVPLSNMVQYNFLFYFFWIYF